MPQTLETDPAKGFIALPMSVFDLDLCPGAFRTLAELCRMANRDGKCWPSLAQLGERLGRSRAAVSGYIAELRDAGLIETETQKMANGYNYRLLYRVVFWKDWRKQLGRTAERRVQPSERPLETQNQIHENQSPAGAVLDDLVMNWVQCVGRAPYPRFDSWPSADLLAKSGALPAPGPVISADIIPPLLDFLEKKGVPSRTLAPDVRRWLAENVRSADQVTGFLAALDRAWKPHWSKAPTLPQIQRLQRSLPPANAPASRDKLIASYLKRWEIYSRSLSSTVPASRVAA